MVADRAPDTPLGDVGLGAFGHHPGTGGALTAHFQPMDFPTDSPFAVQPPSRYPTEEAFYQLARIYARWSDFRRQGADAGLIAPVGGPQHWPSANLFSRSDDPRTAPAGRVNDSGFIPLSRGYPLVREPSAQAAPQGSASVMARPSSLSSAITGLNPSVGEVLSDAMPDGGLSDGQQYAQYRPPTMVRGVKGVTLDEEGRHVLIPETPAADAKIDPLEKLKQRGYPKPPEDPANGSVFVRKLREDNGYGPHRPNYHRYEFKDALCDLGTPGCSVEAAYDALLRHAVPGGPAPGVPIKHEQVSPVSFKGVVPGGRVQTFTERDSNSIINRTLMDHQFRDGYVQRQIVVENGKIYVRTFGEGNNTDAQRSAANNIMAKSAFEDSTAKIRAALRPPEVPIGGQKWPR